MDAAASRGEGMHNIHNRCLVVSEWLPAHNGGDFVWDDGLLPIGLHTVAKREIIRFERHGGGFECNQVIRSRDVPPWKTDMALMVLKDAVCRGVGIVAIDKGK